MKKVFFSTAILLSFVVTAHLDARSQSNDARAPGTQPTTTAYDSRTEEQSANHAAAADSNPGSSAGVPSANAIRRITITSLPADSPPTADSVVENTVTAPAAATSVYRVGVGDVLDIQLLNSPTRESTLFSVLAGGLLEYPLAGEPIRIQGLTTDEIGKVLTSRVRIYDNPKIAVTVREYASHNVIVTGLVRDPGTKPLRREAVPLFIVLAEAQPRADAGRAIIMRPGIPPQTVDITDIAATSMLIYPNDVIRLVGQLPSAPLFFYIIGQIVTPGQRDFHLGMTLTQAIFAAGGTTRSAGSKARVMRQGADGLLITTGYDLKRISQGKDPDPQIEAGDRIEISKSGW